MAVNTTFQFRSALSDLFSLISTTHSSGTTFLMFSQSDFRCKSSLTTGTRIGPIIDDRLRFSSFDNILKLLVPFSPVRFHWNRSIEIGVAIETFPSVQLAVVTVPMRCVATY